MGNAHTTTGRSLVALQLRHPRFQLLDPLLRGRGTLSSVSSAMHGRQWATPGLLCSVSGVHRGKGRAALLCYTSSPCTEAAPRLRLLELLAEVFLLRLHGRHVLGRGRPQLRLEEIHRLLGFRLALVKSHQRLRAASRGGMLVSDDTPWAPLHQRHHMIAHLLRPAQRSRGRPSPSSWHQ